MPKTYPYKFPKHIENTIKNYKSDFMIYLKTEKKIHRLDIIKKYKNM